MAHSGSNLKIAEMSPKTPLRPGVYAPTMAFFDPDTEDLDLAIIGAHTVRLAKAGLVDLVTMSRVRQCSTP